MKKKTSKKKRQQRKDDNFKAHPDPIWRDRADFLIQAEVMVEDSLEAMEQLWARQLGEERFEICCIPFFVYDLALGDEVETRKGSIKYVLDRVVKQSGHYTFRVWLGDSADPNIFDRTLEWLDRMGFGVECYSRNYLAIDAATDDEAQTLADLLQEEEDKGNLVYETGRTH